MIIGQTFRNIGPNVKQAFSNAKLDYQESKFGQQMARWGLKIAMKTRTPTSALTGKVTKEEINGQLTEKSIKPSYVPEFIKGKFKKTIETIANKYNLLSANYENAQYMSPRDINRLARAVKYLPENSDESNKAKEMIKATIGPTIENIDKTEIGGRDLRKLAAAAKIFPQEVASAINQQASKAIIPQQEVINATKAAIIEAQFKNTMQEGEDEPLKTNEPSKPASEVQSNNEMQNAGNEFISIDDLKELPNFLYSSEKEAAQNAFKPIIDRAEAQQAKWYDLQKLLPKKQTPNIEKELKQVGIDVSGATNILNNSGLDVSSKDFHDTLSPLFSNNQFSHYPDSAVLFRPEKFSQKDAKTASEAYQKVSEAIVDDILQGKERLINLAIQVDRSMQKIEEKQEGEEGNHFHRNFATLKMFEYKIADKLESKLRNLNRKIEDVNPSALDYLPEDYEKQARGYLQDNLTRKLKQLINGADIFWL